jgi:Txe/YoeB family toxin of toxin-antitoxin system
MYAIIFSKKAKKDALKMSHSDLKEKLEKLLHSIQDDPFKSPPSFKKLNGELDGYYSRRINKQHRLVYKVDELNKAIIILRMWSHYGDN